MDDQINEKIKSILSDPESLKSILSVASALGVTTASKPEKVEDNSESGFTAEEENVSANPKNVISALTSASAQGQLTPSFSESKTQYNDNRVNLLLSIKPFLSEKKRQRVDSIVKALGAAKLISSYKDLDVLSKFL